MPAKKKKGKGDKKGDKKAKDGPAAPEKTLEDLDKPISDTTKEFYLIQVRDLEGKLERYKEKCDDLQVKYDGLSKSHSQSIKDRDDIIALLKKDLQAESDRVLDLEEQVTGVKQQQEAEKDKYEVQLTTARSDYQEMRDMLTADNMALQGRLKSLEDYRLHKQEMEGKLAEREGKIASQDKEYSDSLNELEKKNLLDRDRLRREMAAKVNSVAAEFRKVSDQQIADTTRRTIRENVAINQQLDKMSSKTEHLLKENDALQRRERELRLQIEIMEENEKAIMRKNKSNQKNMGMLVAKAKEQEERVYELSQFEALCSELQWQTEAAKTESQEYQEETQRAVTASKKLEEELASLRKSYSEVCAEVKRLKAILHQAASAIRASLEPSDSEALLLSKRQGMMVAVLNVLGQVEGRTSPQETRRSSASGGRGSQYVPGDLGFVPRPIPSRLPATSHTKIKKLPALKDLSPLTGTLEARTN